MEGQPTMSITSQVDPSFVASSIGLAAHNNKPVAVSDCMAVCLQQQLVQRAVNSIRRRLQGPRKGIHVVADVLRRHAGSAIEADNVEVVGWSRQRSDARRARRTGARLEAEAD